MSENLKMLSQENWDATIAKGISLVDFFAPWCGPCRMLAPIIEEVATHFAGKIVVGKMDIDKEQDLALKYKVSSVPTMVLYKDGEEIDRIVGLRDFNTLKEWVEKALK